MKLEHRAKKWIPVFSYKRWDKKYLERADDSHFALPALVILVVSAVILSLGLTDVSLAQVAPGVNGSNVHFVKCGASKQGGQVQYAEAGAGRWVSLDQNTAHGTARERNRDQWSVYLFDDQGALVQLDMWQKTCSWIPNRGAASPDESRFYRVLRAETLTP